MKVSVHLGEPYWRALGRREVELSLADGATVAEALAALAAAHPRLGADLHTHDLHPAVFVADALGDLSTPLADGAHVHLVLPVSGG